MSRGGIWPIACSIGSLVFIGGCSGKQNQDLNETPIGNLRQIGLAMMQYENTMKTLPPRANFKDGKPLLSWRVHLLPYLENQLLYEQFHLDEPWDSPHNQKLLAQMPNVYRVPGQAKDARGLTTYVLPTGPGLVSEGEKGTNSTTIQDGPFNTILAICVGSDRAVPWTKPEDAEVNLDKPWEAFGQPPFGDAFPVLFSDMHFEFLTKSVDAATLKALLTKNGGETVTPR